MNSIVCNVKETPDGGKKVRHCLDPKDLNKDIRREHYYTRTIDELPLLRGNKFFSDVDTKKGYWHVELDHESSLLCTFNTQIPAKFKDQEEPRKSDCCLISDIGLLLNT